MRMEMVTQPEQTPRRPWTKAVNAQAIIDEWWHSPYGVLGATADGERLVLPCAYPERRGTLTISVIHDWQGYRAIVTDTEVMAAIHYTDVDVFHNTQVTVVPAWGEEMGQVEAHADTLTELAVRVYELHQACERALFWADGAGL